MNIEELEAIVDDMSKECGDQIDTLYDTITLNEDTYIGFISRLREVIRLAKNEPSASEREADALAVGGIVEAARHNPGNTMAMREALEALNNLFERGVICTSYANSAEEMEQIEELYRKAKAALAAPPRNCDRYANHNDAMKAFEAFVREQGELGFINPYTEAFK